jgi:ketosteroid isomerase-like protein
MKKLETTLIIVLAVISMAARNNPSTAKPANEAYLKPDSAVFNIEKAKLAVTEIDKNIEKALKNGNFAGITPFISTDATIFNSKSDAVVKKENNMVSTWDRAIKTGGKDIRFVIDNISGNPGMLVESGKYEIYGDHHKLIAKGKYLREWKPENGNWKLFKDSSTSVPLTHEKRSLFRCMGL